MPIWNRNKNWEDEYDEYYTRDRSTGTGDPGVSKIRFLAHGLTLLFVFVLFLGAAGSIAGTAMLVWLINGRKGGPVEELVRILAKFRPGRPGQLEAKA